MPRQRLPHHLAALCFASSILLGPAQGGNRQDDPVRALDAELAEWRADVLTRDDGPRALEVLRALVERGEALMLEAPDEALRTEVLGRLYRSDLERLARGGDLRAHALRTAALAETALVGMREAEPVDAARARAAAAALDPGALEALIGGLVETGLPAGGDGDGLLRLTVEEALAVGEVDFVQRLGVDAVESLSALALRPREWAAAAEGADPLATLARIDPAAALDTALLMLDQQGALGRARMLAAFAEVNPFYFDAVWTESGDGVRLADVRWAEIVASAQAGDPSGGGVADRMLLQFARLDHAPPSIAELLPNWILDGGQVPTPPTDVCLQAAETLLERGDKHALGPAADLILAGPDVRALWAVDAASAALMGPSYSRAFGPRTIKVRGADGSTREVDAVPTADAEFLSALERLVEARPDAPPHAALAAVAATGRASGSPVLDAELLTRWSTGTRLQSAPWVAAVIENGLLLDDGARDALLEALAGELARGTAEDLAPSVRATLTVAAAEGAEDLRATFEAFASVGADVREAALASLANVLPGLAESDPAGFHALTGVLLGDAGAEPLRAFIELERSPTTGVRYRPFVPELPTVLAQELVRGLSRTGYDSFQSLRGDDLPLEPAAWLQLAVEPEHSESTRRWMLKRLADSEGQALDPADAGVLARAMALAGESVVGYSDVERLGLDPQEVLRALLDAPGTPDAVLTGFYAPLDDPELVDALVQRLPPATWAEAETVWLHRAILRALAARRDPDLNATLLAANVPSTLLQEMLLEALEITRAEVQLPVAGALLATDRFQTRGVRVRTVELVAGYLNDEAAEHLLAAAKVWRDDGDRALLQAALDDLLAWADAEQRWARGRDTAERRALAVRELVGLLDDGTDATRIEAVRGLAALGATEELPRLIALLDDASAPVREAARAALDRLTE